jgi:hypothetical protein
MCRKLVYSIFLLVLGLMVSVAGADVTSDLVAWWALDDGSGMTARDSAGHPGGPHDGTLQSGPLWESADVRVGRGALKFDGIDDRIVIESFDVQGTGITIAAWIRPPDLAALNDPRLVSKAQGGGTPDHYWAMVLSGSGEDNLEFRLRTDTGAATRRTSPQGNDMQADEWAHLAVTWDANDPFMRLYKNGREIDSVSKAGTAVGVGPGVRIGVGNQSVSAGSGSMDRPTPGILDDVRIYERGLSAEDITELFAWQGAPVPLTLACCPSPADGATDVPRAVVLSWKPGIFAPAINGHKVFLSENFNDVNDGIGGVTQDANSYEPAQRLDLGKTYYWRIDEVNGPPDYTVYQGDVWSFTTEPIGYPIENITATASSSAVAKGPENTVNGSGLDDSALLHDKVGDGTMWLSDVAGPQPTWIEYEFDKAYKLHEMWVWNSNESLEQVIGFGFKDVSIEYSVNGTDYTTLGITHEFARAPGASDYAYNTTVGFGGVAAKYVRLTANSNWGGIVNQYGLSEVRLFHIPVHAREPYPDSGATDVDVNVTLGWRAGREAAEHNVYLSTDEQAVIDGTDAVTTTTETSHGPLSLDLSMTYYWKINEVNMVETPSMLEGDLWSFTTQEYFIVDDFESYNDLDPDDPESNRIFNTWIDGYGIATNGSVVGYENPPFCERTIIHSGSQSMPLAYNNTGGAAYSEAELTLSPPQNWTKAGAATLVLYFYGAEGNTGQLYVKVDGSKVVYDGDAGDIAKAEWNQWSIDLAPLGASLQSVTKLVIGVDGNGATGTLYVDDIRLYRLAPESQAN